MSKKTLPGFALIEDATACGGFQAAAAEKEQVAGLAAPRRRG
ncbi:hypothetical protein [Paracoccus luteus]|nr:hypothetical protein [Paracoccus luteus]